MKFLMIWEIDKMKPPTTINALKAALDYLEPLSECSKRTFGIFGAETGILRTDVKRAAARILLLLNELEESDQDVDADAPNYNSEISKL